MLIYMKYTAHFGFSITQNAVNYVELLELFAMLLVDINAHQMII